MVWDWAGFPKTELPDWAGGSCVGYPLFEELLRIVGKGGGKYDGLDAEGWLWP